MEAYQLLKRNLKYCFALIIAFCSFGFSANAAMTESEYCREGLYYLNDDPATWGYVSDLSVKLNQGRHWAEKISIRSHMWPLEFKKTDDKLVAIVGPIGECRFDLSFADMSEEWVSVVYAFKYDFAPDEWNRLTKIVEQNTYDGVMSRNVFLIKGTIEVPPGFKVGSSKGGLMVKITFLDVYDPSFTPLP